MLKLAELNGMGREEFTKIIGPVFEHSPWIAEQTWEHRPFKTRDDLHRSLTATVARSSDQQKLDLIRAHPDLVGRATLTSESQTEQACAGLTDLSHAEVEQFQSYNRRYREKFNFPFVICARLNKKEAILSAFPQRLGNSVDQETNTALGEIGKIAELRLRDIVE